ncbi:hypothetical protein AAHC03_016642 [Spirometra sp. Aus1]
MNAGDINQDETFAWSSYWNILHYHICVTLGRTNALLRPYDPLVLIGLTLSGIFSVYLLIALIERLDNLRNWKALLFRFVTALPRIRSIKSKKLQEVKKSIFTSVHGKSPQFPYRQALPPKPMSADAIKSTAGGLSSGAAVDWRSGRMSGTVYPANEELNQLILQIQEMYLWTNPLHADAFPSVRRMEAEVVRMCLTMFHGDENTCGTMSSGGTESIMLACLAYRNRARKMGIREPNMVIPESAHTAFDKAGSVMNIRVIRVPLDPVTFKVNLKALKAAITSQTCMLVASAPQFPHGIIDPVTEIAKIGLKRRIPVHVDSCLGGFLLPFMEEAGFPLEDFDFRVPGVTSISCDTHKYGFAAKGTSVIMYRNQDLRSCQFFSCPDWTGGVYASPTFAGSRSGALIAACWSAMLFHGQEGYVSSTRRIISTTRQIADGIRQIRGLKVLGEPMVSVVAFTSEDFDIYQLGDLMSVDADGSPKWGLNMLQFPSAVHLCVTDMHTREGVAEGFLADLEKAATTLLNSPKQSSSGMAAVYGMCQLIPDRSLVASVAASFLDACYATQSPFVENS